MCVGIAVRGLLASISALSVGKTTVCLSQCVPLCLRGHEEAADDVRGGVVLPECKPASTAGLCGDVR